MTPFWRVANPYPTQVVLATKYMYGKIMLMANYLPARVSGASSR